MTKEIKTREEVEAIQNKTKVLFQCKNSIVLQSHDLMDQAGARDFILLDADAILREHVLDKFCDMEKSGGEFLHMYWLVEQFLHQLKLRAVRYSVVFFQCQEEGLLKTNWYETKHVIDEEDELTHENKILTTYNLKSTLEKVTPVYKMAKRILRYILEEKYNIECITFKHYFDDTYLQYLRDVKPTLIFSTYGMLLPSYYIYGKYDLNMALGLKFQGSTIWGFSTDYVESDHIMSKTFMEEIKSEIENHLEECGIPILKEAYYTEKTKGVSKVTMKAMTIPESIQGSEDQQLEVRGNKLNNILKTLCAMLTSYDTLVGEVDTLKTYNVDKSMATVFAQILFGSVLLQHTLPVSRRGFTLETESRETAIELTKFLHLFYYTHEGLIEAGDIDANADDYVDFISGRMFHQLVYVVQELGWTTSHKVPLEVDATLMDVYKQAQTILLKHGSTKGNVEKAWETLVTIEKQRAKAKQVGDINVDALIPVENDYVTQYLDDMKNNTFNMLDDAHVDEILKYDESIDGLYNLQESERVRLNKNTVANQQLIARLAKYAHDLNLLQTKRTIVSTQNEDKRKKKERNKHKTKTAIVVLQLTNRLNDVKEKYETNQDMDVMRELLKECYEIWRTALPLPLNNNAKDIMNIMEDTWVIISYLMLHILKGFVDKFKSKPQKTEREKWEIFHELTFVSDLARHLHRITGEFETEIKDKYKKKKNLKPRIRKPLLEQAFVEQFQAQLVKGLENLGFERQADLMQGKTGDEVTRENSFSPWRLELEFHYAENSHAQYLPPNRVKVGQEWLDLGFIPDPWQEKMIEYVEKDESVLVSAPTSSGKTFIAFYVIEKILRRNDTDVVAFVLPTTALINQVYTELLAKFNKNYINDGQHMLGIRSGGTRINETSCQILITTPMSLEQYLLDPASTKWKQQLKYMILDEIHTLNEFQVGNEWENILTHTTCPFVALSATLGNPKPFSEWLSQKTGSEVRVIEHHERPRPLEYSVYEPNFDQEEIYIPSFIEGARKAEEERKALFEAARRAQNLELAEEEEEEGEEGEDKPKDEKKSKRELDASDDFDEDDEEEEGEESDEEEEGDDKENEQVGKKASDRIEELNISQGSFHEIHPTAVLNPKKVVADEIKNMFSMSPRQCLRLYDAAQRLAADTNSTSILAKFDPNICLEQIEMISAEKFIAYRREMSDYLKEMAQDEKNHAILLKLFGIMRENIDESFSRIYNNIEPFQYNRDDFVYANFIGLIRKLRSDKKLPAIIFNFDHFFIDQLMDLLMDFVTTTGFNLWNSSVERRTCQEKIRITANKLPKSIDEKYKAALKLGIAVHYTSMGDDYLMEAERLFRSKMIPIIIATSTLALGINMPCKTVVIAGKSIYLSTNSFNQMSGRAGRRGFDSKGNVILYGIPKTAISRFMTSSSSNMIGMNTYSPMYYMQLLLMYNQQKDESSREYIRKRLDHILKNNQQSISKETISVNQLKYHFRYSLEFLLRNGIIETNGQPRDLSAVASQLATVVPYNMMLTHMIMKGTLHRRLMKELKINLEMQTRFDKEISELKAYHLRELEQLKKNNRRAKTAPLRKKQNRQLSSLRKKHYKQKLSVFAPERQEELVRLLCYLFPQTRFRTTIYSDDVASIEQMDQVAEDYFESKDNNTMKGEKIPNRAICNVLDPMASFYLENLTQYYNSTVNIFDRFLNHYSERFPVELKDNAFGDFKTFVDDQVLRHQIAVAKAAEEAVQESEAAEATQPEKAESEGSDADEWDSDGSDDIDEWDSDAELDEDVEESGEQEETNKTVNPLANIEIKAKARSILESKLESMAIIPKGVSSYAALSGNTNNFSSVSQLLFTKRHTILLDPNDIPVRELWQHPVNSIFFDYFTHGQVPRLARENLATNINTARRYTKDMYKTFKSFSYSLVKIKNPKMNSVDTLQLLLEEVISNLRLKIEGQKAIFKHRKKNLNIKISAEEIHGKKSKRADKAYGEANPDEEDGPRRRKQSGRENDDTF